MIFTLVRRLPSLRLALATLGGLLPLLAAAPAGAQSLPQGVAAGDTTVDSSILWTRSTVTGQVRFDVATDPGFTNVVVSNQVNVANAAIPIKSSVTGLTADTQYYYRARNAAGVTSSGQFRTLAAPGTQTGLRFGVSGDWFGGNVDYLALTNAPSRDLDFFVALGDTAYADLTSPAGGAASSLAQFRNKQAEVYDNPAMMNLRESTSWYATIDDHEVRNDFSGGANPSTDTRFQQTGSYINDTALFDNGLRAFQEYNPIADTFYGATGDPRTAGERNLYRTRQFGQDAVTFMLDARSFRDSPLGEPDLFNLQGYINDSFNPARTMLGRAQIDTLKTDLLAAQNADVTWKFILVPEPIQYLGPFDPSDRFEGYEAERTEILKFIDDHDIENVVFISADIHNTVVNDLTYRRTATGPDRPLAAWEISTGALYGPTPGGFQAMQEALALGLVSQEQYDEYLTLPVRDKDAFFNSLLDELLPSLSIFNYHDVSPFGLTDSPLISAELLSGTWNIGHSWGWTEFEIDATTQDLLVTTYGIDTQGVITSPEVFGQFRVHAVGVPEPSSLVLAASAMVLLPLLGNRFRRSSQPSRHRDS
ncbi:MAG: alkaline phosphatase D family protein [Pirellulales bacterium]|nr:alkaline phosphatase D family protein [Pirellulales bacterium]